MDRGVWWATVHGITKESDMIERLNNNSYLFHTCALSSAVLSNSCDAWTVACQAGILKVKVAQS